MSFILDALKKSESDRQRQNGPALFEVKVAPPRTRLPLWALAIAALLVVNLAIVMWMVLRHPARAAAEEGLAGVATPAVAHPATAAAPAATPAPAPTPAVAPSVVAAAAPVTAAPTVPAAPLTTAARASGAGAGAASAETPGTTGTSEESNPDDYAPAQEHPAAQALGNHVKRGTAEGVPLYQDAAGTPGTQIPQLRLDLHVFAERPQERFVMINMHKLREGDTLPEGVHVDSITPDGAILSYKGSRFLLPRE
jgi:general secretion pathway protein B